MTLLLFLIFLVAFGIFRKGALLVLLGLCCVFAWKFYVLGGILIFLGLVV